MRSIEDVALAFSRACEAANVRYALVGGVAVLAWGQPRATMDVDALVQLKEKALPPFVEALAHENFQVSAEDLSLAIQERSHATVFDQTSPLHVDVKPAQTPEELQEVEDAVDVPYQQGRLRLARPEDVIAFKLKYGTPQDLGDARSVLVRQRGKLDLGRLQRTAARLGVLKQLEEVSKGLP